MVEVLPTLTARWELDEEQPVQEKTRTVTREEGSARQGSRTKGTREWTCLSFLSTRAQELSGPRRMQIGHGPGTNRPTWTLFAGWTISSRKRHRLQRGIAPEG
mmetsp:Transcript_5705/g.19953  ORF Transcript_5705/g.19953 Transcript_5705/m.19953 type:complete len:103 (+) Transcript_5705:431-739(+)